MSDTRGNVIIRLTDVDKSFDDERVVKKLNLDVEEGEFLTMLGPSGCGVHDTAMIAGRARGSGRGDEHVDGAHHELGRVVLAPDVAVPHHRREERSVSRHRDQAGQPVHPGENSPS